MKRKILAFISILVMIFTVSCNSSDGSNNYITVRTEYRNTNYCYRATVPVKEMKKIKEVLLDDKWLFEYNEELRINSKYKLYSGEQSFYVAPDTDYVFLRVADGDTFEWRKAEKDSKIAKKALELLSDIEYKYRSEPKPEGWKNQVLYNPDKEGQPSYFVRIMDKDAQKLADALEGESYTQTIAVDIAKQYSIILDGKQYYVTNSIDKVILQRVNSEGPLWTEISKDSDIAKKINGILEKAVDIEPTFWCEYSY